MRALLYPVWNDEERRPRALVRVGLQLALLILAAPIVQYAIVKTNDAADDHPEAIFGQAAVHVAWGCVVLWAAAIGARWLDRRPLDDLGLRVDRGFWLDLTFGVVLGGALMAGILGAELALGLATYAEAPPMPGEVPRLAFVPITVFVFLAVALWEEVVFRGYHLTNLAEGMTTRWTSPAVGVVLAILVSSAVFAWGHADNPNATPFGIANIALAGVMLAAGYVTTGQLAIPIGLHLGWNLFQNLFGMAVSGNTQFAYGHVFAREVTGPAWLTGGAFGPEAGMTGLVAIGLGTALVLAYVRMRHGPLGLHPSWAQRRPSRA